MSAESILMRAMQRYWRWTRGLTLGVQAVVFDDAGRVLLVRHSYRPGWHFPGGGVEFGETATTALKRELMEETGVVVVSMPELFGLYTNFDWFPGDHIALFKVPQWQQPSVPVVSREIAEQGFFPPETLPENTSRGTQRRLLEILGGSARQEHW